MDAPLSAYWVKFFKNAGFPSDVATRHAVIFSNNRIKPDMLPDLDKPSLKEMGITLMGDMIAILRYAKKVVEETTCKKFLGTSEDSSPTKTVVKPAVKKVVGKATTKATAAAKVKVETQAKAAKTTLSTATKPTLTVKKHVPTLTSRLYSVYLDSNQKPKLSPLNPLKRKYNSDEDSDDKWTHNESEKHHKVNDDDMVYKVVNPKVTTVRSQNTLKKAVEQRKTVFHRLGDSMVSSTTSSVESSNSTFNPTFNVTGLGRDFKQSSSVFNRLGNKDIDNELLYSRLRNGNASTSTHGILKTHTPGLSATGIGSKTALKKPIGTMRADEEANKKAVSQSVRQLVRTTKTLNVNETLVRGNSLTRKISVGKLASDRLSVPAKSRLGVSKQVTFNNTATVNYIKKPGVFSRLGV